MKRFLFTIMLFHASMGYSLLYYMNDLPLSFKSVLTGALCTYLDYNTLNNGTKKSGDLGGDIRLCGIHNMWVQVSGYERIDLVKDDVCLQPHLFTILGYMLPNKNVLTQRWACIKWYLPLTFSFDVVTQTDKNNTVKDVLNVSSTISQYRFFTLFRSKAMIPLVKNSSWSSDVSDPIIEVSVNGRGVIIQKKQMVQIYSTSGAVLSSQCWPLTFL